MNTLLDDLLLAVPGQDLAYNSYAHKMAQAIPQVLAKFQGKIDSALFIDIMRQSHLYQTLPADARRQLVTHPYFGYWWLKLMERYMEKNRQRVEEWLQEFGRFLFVPCLKHGIWNGEAWPMPVNKHHEIRFPGHVHHFFNNSWLPGQLITITQQDQQLILTNGNESYQVALIDFLESDDIHYHPLLRKRVILENTGIELDGSDPWVEVLFTSINSRPPMEGYPPRDLAVVETITPDVTSYFTQAIRLLEEVWPELASEFHVYTRVIVPFQSNCYSTFTEAAFMGVLFMGEVRHPFSDILYTAEHLLHEQSHLRLTLFMELYPLYHADGNALYPSPFRRDPRPLIGIIQGIFVFARIARFLRLGEKRFGDPAYRKRLIEVVRDLQAALKVLSEITDLTFTPVGQDLMDQIKAESNL